MNPHYPVFILAVVILPFMSILTKPLPLTPRKSTTGFLRPMMKLLASTLEIVHYLRENPQLSGEPAVDQIEKLAVPMYEHIAYHSAKVSNSSHLIRLS